MKLNSFFIAIILLISLSGCDEEDEFCEECNKAIVHMYEKIADFNCDPGFMEEANNRIQEECGASVRNIAVGFMAHKCLNEPDNFFPPVCEKDIDMGKIYSINEVQINITVSTFSPDHEQLRIYIISDIIEKPQELNILEGFSIDFTLNSIFNAEPIDILLIDTSNETDSVVFSMTENLYYYRPGKWNLTRKVDINYIPILEQYDGVTTNW